MCVDFSEFFVCMFHALVFNYTDKIVSIKFPILLQFNLIKLLSS